MRKLILPLLLATAACSPVTSGGEVAIAAIPVDILPIYPEGV